MSWTEINLEEVLKKERRKEQKRTPDDVLTEFRQLFEREDQRDEWILNNILKEDKEERKYDLGQINPEHIYSESQIKKICTDYRLRFLDASLFKGEIPYEAIAKVKRLQKNQSEELTGFKILAPANMFNLKYKDKDPLLMLPLSDGRYYLVHKWGSEMNIFRKIAVFPFRNFKTLIATVAMFAAFVVAMIPDSVIMGPYDQSSLGLRVIFFIYLFIAFSGLTVLYGFSRVKNFNSALWKSKYLD